MEYATFEQKHYNMAKIARTLAFIAIVSALFQTVIFPFIFGGLAILFAILSKGNTSDYSMSAKLSIIMGISALVINILILGLGVYRFISDPSAVNEWTSQMNEMCQLYYGMSYEEMIAQIKNAYFVTQ